MEPVTMVHVSRTERPDSIEIGTPGKGGCVKVFFDAGDPEDAEKRIRNAMILRERALAMQTGGAT
jgi:hypothetical protein